jgi:hypothetical protein
VVVADRVDVVRDNRMHGHGEPSRLSCRLHAGCGSGWRAVVAA